MLSIIRFALSPEQVSLIISLLRKCDLTELLKENYLYNVLLFLNTFYGLCTE